jgi:hypothetical protein
MPRAMLAARVRVAKIFRMILFAGSEGSRVFDPFNRAGGFFIGPILPFAKAMAVRPVRLAKVFVFRIRRLGAQGQAAGCLSTTFRPAANI